MIVVEEEFEIVQSLFFQSLDVERTTHYQDAQQI